MNLFDIEGSVKKTLWDALGQASKLTGAPLEQVRIKICSPEGDGEMAFHLLAGNKQVTTYCDIRKDAFLTKDEEEIRVDLYLLMDKAIDLFNVVKMASGLLTNVVKNLAFQKGIAIEDADFRIYTRNDENKEPLMSMIKKTGEGERDVEVINFTMEEVVKAGNMEGVVTNLQKQAQQ